MLMFAQQLEAAPTNTLPSNKDYYTPDDFWLFLMFGRPGVVDTEILVAPGGFIEGKPEEKPAVSRPLMFYRSLQHITASPRGKKSKGGRI